MIELVITTAGKQALINAQSTGTNAVTIDKIAVGTGKYTPVATQTSLQSEVKRLPIVEGASTGDNAIHVVFRDESNSSYSIYEFGLFLTDGTLFAVYSSSNAVFQKTANSIALLAVDVTFEDIDATQITFGDVTFSNAAATTTNAGVIAIATDAEVIAGAATQKAITPAGLQAMTASASRAGLVQYATNTQAEAGTSASRAVTPAGLKYTIDARLKAVEIDTYNRIENSDGNGNFSVYPSGVAGYYQARAGANQLTLSRFSNDDAGNSIVLYKSRATAIHGGKTAIAGDKIGQINFMVDNGNINYSGSTQGARAAHIEGGVFESSSLTTAGTTNLGVRGYLRLYCCSDENNRDGKGIEILDNSFRPTVDNDMNLGTAGRRFKAVFATTGTINTSDVKTKQDIEGMSEAENALAFDLARKIKRFRFKDEVSTNAANAQKHTGVIAQEVLSAFDKAGIDAGAMIVDFIDANEEPTLGVRYSDLLAFIVSGMAAKIDSLEKRLEALEGGK